LFGERTDHSSRRGLGFWRGGTGVFGGNGKPNGEGKKGEKVVAIVGEGVRTRKERGAARGGRKREETGGSPGGGCKVYKQEEG